MHYIECVSHVSEDFVEVLLFDATVAHKVRCYTFGYARGAGERPQQHHRQDMWWMRNKYVQLKVCYPSLAFLNIKGIKSPRWKCALQHK